MKKIFLIFSLFVLFLTGCSETEPQKPKSDSAISKETKKKSIKTSTNIVHALSTYLYRDGLKSKDTLTEEEKKKLNKKYEKYEKSSKPNIEKIAELLGSEPISLDRSESFILAYRNDSTQLDINNLSKSIISELVKLNKDREDESKGSKYGDFQKFKDKIKSIEDDLIDEIEENKKENDNVKKIYELWKTENTKSSIPTLLYVTLVILFVLLAAAIYFIKIIYDSLEKLKIKREHDKQRFNDLKYNHDRLNNKVAVINIDAVRDEMYEQMNILARRINDTQSEQVRDVRSTPQAKPEPKIFYAQYPDSADPVGFKNIQFESNSKMVYRITRIEGNKARFIIQPDENTQQYAIGNHGKILKPVCEYLNQPSSMNRTIKVFREGRLEMQNNIWIVVEKLKIKFE